MLEFDPNKPNEKATAWATYIPGRKPKFKTYAKVNHASSALAYAGLGILYKMIDGEWVEQWRRDEKQKHCDKCGKNKHEYEGRFYSVSLYHITSPWYLSKLYCSDCHREWRRDERSKKTNTTT